MKNKILLALICTLFLSIGSVCATDLDDNLIQNDTNDDLGINESYNISNENIRGNISENINGNDNNPSFADVQKLIDNAAENGIIELNNTTYYGNGH